MQEYGDKRGFVPAWNGDPSGWKSYRDEVRIWALGEKLDVEYSLAARLVSRLGGPARRAAMGLKDSDLMPLRPVIETHSEDGHITRAGVAGDTAKLLNATAKHVTLLG